MAVNNDSHHTEYSRERGFYISTSRPEVNQKYVLRNIPVFFNFLKIILGQTEAALSIVSVWAGICIDSPDSGGPVLVREELVIVGVLGVLAVHAHQRYPGLPVAVLQSHGHLFC